MSIAIDSTRSPEMVDERLPEWLKEAQEMFNQYYIKVDMVNQTPFLYIAGGRKYIKIAKRSHGSNSVWCFIRAEDGAILKAATWKAPALNFKRGSIFDANVPQQPYGF